MATLCIVEFAQYLKIPVCVYGHCTDFRRPEHFGKETVCLHSYMEFEDRYEKLKAEAADLWNRTSEDGLVDNLSWGFEKEKVEKRQEAMAEANVQLLPLDD